MNAMLTGKTVAVLVANGFEEIDMTEPQRAFLGAGAVIKLVSPEQGLVNGWHGRAWGHYFPVDVPLSTSLAADFDALVVPGGERGVAKLRGNAHALRFLRGFMDGGKPVALIGTAPLLLIDAERASGRTVACAAEVCDELTGAGARLGEEAVVLDKNLLTCAGSLDDAAARDAVVKHAADVTSALADAA
ncbi:MAG: peptidase C56 [Alphaproteobacteria bacterium]|jgi:putative intracellular protease/amidase|nr:peptidase C56 [Alphaproteobacteria bacterium]